MKTITIIGANPLSLHSSPTLAPFGATDHIITGPEEMSVSDGYHTFDELYDHRIALYIALCKHLHELLGMENPGKFKVWRSKKHSDGSEMEGWFIMGIGIAEGRQITYHIPDSFWGDCYFAEEFDSAPKWDGHTSADVLERLKVL